jgi:hypothetical protein
MIKVFLFDLFDMDIKLNAHFSFVPTVTHLFLSIK